MAIIRVQPQPPPRPAASTPGGTYRLMPEFSSISIAEFLFMRNHARTVALFAATWVPGIELRQTVDGEAARVEAQYVSGTYFEIAGVRMARGRGFLPDDDDPRAPRPVVIISDRLWRTAFGSDPSIAGRTVFVGQERFTIAGVTPPAFLDLSTSRTDVWMPLAASLIIGPASPAGFTDPRQKGATVGLAGRLRPGATRDQAHAELTGLSRQFREAHTLPIVELNVRDTRPISGGGMRQARQTTALLFGALMLVLLLACANVGNLLLARGLARQREIAIRLSLGAGRARVIRQMLVETSILAAAAAVIGLAIAHTLPALVARYGDWTRQRPEFFSPDATVFGFAVAIAAMTTLVCGLAPALQATRVRLAEVAGTRHGAPARSVRLRRWLLVAQVALATILLSAAGLMSRGVEHALGVDPGFPIAELHTVSIAMPSGTPRARRSTYFEELAAAVKAAGMPAVAFADQPPLSDDPVVILVRYPHESRGATRGLNARAVSPNYYEMLGMRFVAGRPQRPNDGYRELVVSELAARALWPGENPIGKTLLGGMDDPPTVHEVVGVVADVHGRSLTSKEPVIYQNSDNFQPLLLLRDHSPAAVERIAAIAKAIDPAVTVTSRPLADHTRDLLESSIVAGRVAWAIGALGLFLATVGAFGVFSYAVEQRRREIGIRMALGARAIEVVRMVLRTTAGTLLAGTAIGCLAAAIAATLLRHYLNGLSPYDPLAYVQIALILLAAASLAAAIPARRATRVDPAVTLRSD
jgi:predicted permease